MAEGAHYSTCVKDKDCHTGTFFMKLWERRIFPPGLFVVETERSRSGGESLSGGFKSGKNPTESVAGCTATTRRTQVEMRATETH